jgi:ribulose-phosphate 3-epimerase
MIDDRNLKTHIEIDGGVSLENASKLLKAGADTLVAGNTVFKSQDPIETIRLLKHSN